MATNQQTESPVIHLLLSGGTPCTVVNGVPNQWPAGHVWSSDEKEVTCEKCLTWVNKYGYESRL